jgi:hypothetical protein
MGPIVGLDIKNRKACAYQNLIPGLPSWSKESYTDHVTMALKILP